MRSILLLGVGEIGLNQIKWAQETGFFVIAVDQNPGAPSLKLANLGVNISATNTRAITSWALENKEKYNIRAVYSGNDLGVFSAAIVARAIGIEYLSTSDVVKGLSKSLMKRSWYKKGVKTPDYKFIQADLKDDELNLELDFPQIIKPLDSSGSQGIRLIKNLVEFKDAYKETRKYTNSDQIILEKFVDGRHIDGNAFFWNGKFYPCGLSERIFSPFPYRVPVGGYESIDFTENEKTEIYREFEYATRSLGIEYGPVKGDFILSEDGINIIEISPRFHGDVGTSHITYYRTGASHLQVYLETLYKGEVPLKKLDKILNCNRVCGWQVLDLPFGEVKNLVQASEEASKTVNVENVFIRPRGPKAITRLINNNDIIGFVWATGEKRKDVDDILDNYMNTLKKLLVYETDC